MLKKERRTANERQAPDIACRPTWELCPHLMPHRPLRAHHVQRFKPRQHLGGLRDPQRRERESQISHQVTGPPPLLTTHLSRVRVKHQRMAVNQMESFMPVRIQVL